MLEISICQVKHLENISTTGPLILQTKLVWFSLVLSFKKKIMLQESLIGLVLGPRKTVLIENRPIGRVKSPSFMIFNLLRIKIW